MSLPSTGYCFDVGCEVFSRWSDFELEVEPFIPCAGVGHAKTWRVLETLAHKYDTNFNRLDRIFDGVLLTVKVDGAKLEGWAVAVDDH